MAAKAQTLYRPFPRSTASAPPAAQAGMVILVAGTGDAAQSAGTAFIPASVVAVESGTAGGRGPVVSCLL